MSIGIDEIDDQHKELFIRINNLLDTMGREKGIEEVKSNSDFAIKAINATLLPERDNRMSW